MKLPFFFLCIPCGEKSLFSIKSAKSLQFSYFAGRYPFMKAGFPPWYLLAFVVERKTMTRRQISVIALCCVLFYGSFIHFAAAEVVHAYRKPSETDLAWLLGDAPELIPNVGNSSEIVQAGYASEKSSTLALPGDPCTPAKLPKPVRLPNPPIPPAPKAAHNKMNTGLVDEEEGIVNITSTVRDSRTSIEQMASNRLPPPSEVPKEPEINFAIPLTEPAVERLPTSDNKEPSLIFSKETIVDFGSVDDGHFIDSFGEPGACGDGDIEFTPCVCLTCLACGDHRKTVYIGNEEWLQQFDAVYATDCGTLFYAHAPDMLGSSAWLTGYYVETSGTAFIVDAVTKDSTATSAFSSKFTLPTMLLTRPNVVEHFNANVQNRIWTEYRHWNNVVSIDRSYVDIKIDPITGEPQTSYSESSEYRGIEQFTIGVEKQFARRCSVELHVPIIYQFGSKQMDETAATAELGNISLFFKQAMSHGPRWTFAGGVGTSLPSAPSWEPFENAKLKNSACSLVMFLGAQWHPNPKTFGHFVVQADIPTKENELIVVGEPVKKVAGQRAIRTGIQFGRWIYRADNDKRPCRFGVFSEVNYAVVTAGSPAHSLQFSTENGNLYEKQEMYVSAFNSRRSTLTAALGVPMTFGKLTCMNSLILPISGSDRPFSVGYSASLSRQF